MKSAAVVVAPSDNDSTDAIVNRSTSGGRERLARAITTLRAEGEVTVTNLFTEEEAKLRAAVRPRRRAARTARTWGA
jgi:hypothetical protein